MRSTTEIVRRPLIVSDWNPIIQTSREDFAPAFAWADDEESVAWKIVTGTKSKAFGSSSNVYGPSSTNSVADIAMRIAIFHEFAVTKSEHASLWSWAARFTLTHYEEPGFTGGFFQQVARWTDGKEYERACATLDYTSRRRVAVFDRFYAWAKLSFTDTTKILIDGKRVRRVVKKGRRRDEEDALRSEGKT